MLSSGCSAQCQRQKDPMESVTGSGKTDYGITAQRPPGPHAPPLSPISPSSFSLIVPREARTQTQAHLFHSPDSQGGSLQGSWSLPLAYKHKARTTATVNLGIVLNSPHMIAIYPGDGSAWSISGFSHWWLPLKGTGLGVVPTISHHHLLLPQGFCRARDML